MREYRENRTRIACLRAELRRRGEDFRYIGHFLIESAERVQVATSQIIVADYSRDKAVSTDSIDISKIGELTNSLRKAVEKERQFEQTLKSAGYENVIYPKD